MTNSVLMCHPEYFTVSYDINPWMTSQIGLVDNEKAKEQWFELLNAISKTIPVYVLKGEEKLPDLVFTANAGFVFNKTVILSKFAKQERQLEEQIFQSWFNSKEFTVVQPKQNYEGEGDHLIDSLGRHWVGSGFRTDKKVKKELEAFLNHKVNMLELVDARWYHLDTCFCPLPNGELLWYPNAFSENSQNLIRKNFTKTIEVSIDDALSFCCNCVCIENSLFLPKTKNVKIDLDNLGYSVNEFELTEFIKAGGAAKCLVLKL